jgi:hypothetical protein
MLFISAQTLTSYGKRVDVGLRGFLFSRFDVDFSSLKVELVKLCKSLNSTFRLLVPHKTNTKRSATTSLPEGNLNISDFAVLPKQLLKFFFCYSIRQVHNIQAFVIYKVVLSCEHFWVFFFFGRLFSLFCFIFHCNLLRLNLYLLIVHKAFELVIPTLLFAIFCTQQ